MNKKIFKKILIILILFMILIVAYRLINTYALFYSETQGVVKQANATWRIYVNNKDITANSSNKFTIDSFEMDENSHVADGKIAPGVTGNFFIIIDPKKTDVSIKYSIQLDKEYLINDKISIVSVEEVESGNTLTRTDETTYTGLISLSDIKAWKTNKIKVRLSWENDENNNQMDTTLGTLKGYTVNIPINVTATQYLGETIEEYMPEETTWRYYEIF